MRKKKLFFVLFVSSFVFFIRSIWSVGALNAFNLDLVRVWNPDTLVYIQSQCTPLEDIETLQRMQHWLEWGAIYDTNEKLHQGEVSCLLGDVEQAKKIWIQDVEHPSSSLFSTMIYFSQGIILETSYSEEFGEYGFRNGKRWEEKNPNTAIMWYTFAMSYKPSKQTATGLVRLYHSQGKDDLVKKTWQQVADAFPASTHEHWLALGKLADLSQDLEMAAYFYSKGADLADSKVAYGLLMMAGNRWLQVKTYNQAEDAFHQALVINPDKIDAYLRLGDVFRYQNQYDKAISWYQKVQAVEPNHDASLYYIGLMKQALGLHDEALIYFNQSLKLQPHEAKVLYEKAITLDALNRRNEARETLIEAISLKDDFPESWMMLLEKWEVE